MTETKVRSEQGPKTLEMAINQMHYYMERHMPYNAMLVGGNFKTFNYENEMNAEFWYLFMRAKELVYSKYRSTTSYIMQLRACPDYTGPDIPNEVLEKIDKDYSGPIYRLRVLFKSGHKPPRNKRPEVKARHKKSR